MTDVETDMPGIVLRVLVGEGEEVTEGDTVVVIEAMKNEVEINATASGTVTAVHVSVDDEVMPQQALITLE